jgi:hypothetical protein
MGTLSKCNDEGIYHGNERAPKKKIQGFPHVFTLEKF